MGTVTNQGVASWGVTGEVSGVTGIVTQIRTSKETIHAPEHNELGQVVKQTLYDRHETATATIEVAADAEPPSDKDAITIGGVTGYVLRSDTVEANNAYKHIEVQIEAYETCKAYTIAEGSGL